jgi:cysteine desulfuration protein SufE
MATEAFEEIADTFEFLDDWEDRYRHVIDMGKAMAPLDDAFKVGHEGRRLRQPGLDPAADRGRGAGRTVRFRGRQRRDHRARADRGPARALFRAAGTGGGGEGRRGGGAGATGLDEHLSAQRSNGVRAMVGRIRALAAERARPDSMLRERRERKRLFGK